MGKTIKKIATIADVDVDLSCKSIHNDGNCKNQGDSGDENALCIKTQAEQIKEDSASTEQEKTLTLKEFIELDTCTREDISTFLNTLIDSAKGIDLVKIKLMKTTEKGKLLKPWLQLQRIPKTNREMKFFCLLSTAKKEDIKNEYYKKKKRFTNVTWTMTLASFIRQLKKFNWRKSFDDLADAKADQNDRIFLWLADDAFERHFFSSNSKAET